MSEAILMNTCIRAVVVAASLVGALLPISPAAAANAAPKIRAARLVDGDGDGKPNKVVLTYTERIRHRRDADGKYPFKVEGYAIKRVDRARRAQLTIVLKEADGPARPKISYKRTQSKPVRDRRGKQAKAQDFFGVLPLEYTLTITEPEHGNVKSSPAGIDCGDGGTDCRAEFKRGSLVSLSATPVDGGAFTSWTLGTCGATSTCLLKMSSDRSLSAVFQPPPGGGTVTVTLDGALGTESVTSTPAGIDCTLLNSGGCEFTFPGDVYEVTLTAAASPLTTFEGWTNCTPTSTVGTCTLSLDGTDKAVGATFGAAVEVP